MSCNIPSNVNSVDISVIWKGNLEANSYPIIKNTPNDGQELITLPNSTELVSGPYMGKEPQYVVHIQMNIPGQNYTANGDSSDNSFTINTNNNQQIDTTLHVVHLKALPISFSIPNNRNIVE